MTNADPLLAVEDVSVVYSQRRRPTRSDRAVDGVSFEIHRGEAIGLVGESGCGKSSLARTIVSLQRASSGVVRYDTNDLTNAPSRKLARFRRGMTLVFQDPSTSLNPRRTIRQSLDEALRATTGVPLRGDDDERLQEVLSLVGLGIEVASRYPHQMSGGQLQRVSIARALICDPKLIVLDEPVSALDVSVQAQIIEILLRIREESSASLLFIAHDLAVVRQVCERVLIMYLGRVVEEGPTDEVFRSPQHPYTQALLAAVPIADPTKRRARQSARVVAEIGAVEASEEGCRFAPRCPRADETCLRNDPQLVTNGQRAVACHHVDDPTGSSDPVPPRPGSAREHSTYGAPAPEPASPSTVNSSER